MYKFRPKVANVPKGIMYKFRPKVANVPNGPIGSPSLGLLGLLNAMNS